MISPNIWTILGIVTIVLLIVFWRKRNAVWGGLAIGVIIGLVTTAFFAFKGHGFNWHIIGKAAISGTIIGFIAELLGKVSDYLQRKKADSILK